MPFPIDVLNYDEINLHADAMTQWLADGAVDAARVTSRTMGEKVDMTEAGVRIAARTMAVVFPGAVLFLLTTACAGILGLFFKHAELATQVRFQNQISQSAIQQLSDQYRELNIKNDALEAELRDLSNQLIRLQQP